MHSLAILVETASHGKGERTCDPHCLISYSVHDNVHLCHSVVCCLSLQLHVMIAIGEKKE